MGPTTTEGQLALYPTLTEEQAKVAAKRENSRCNAARARKRNKDMMVVLQERVSRLTKRTDNLSRSNNDLKTQIDDLKTQNRELMTSRSAGELQPRSVSSYANSSYANSSYASSSYANSSYANSSYANSSTDNSNSTVLQLLNALQNQKKRQQESSISQLLSEFAAGQQQGASNSNLLPLLQTGLVGGNT
jgi:hypothetical protein